MPSQKPSRTLNLYPPFLINIKYPFLRYNITNWQQDQYVTLDATHTYVKTANLKCNFTHIEDKTNNMRNYLECTRDKIRYASFFCKN